ncbi:Lichenan-specific phosphotransferase enzyme IIB component [Paraliobacillus sp. PM-2]|uniref:PTS sugar transporter subunit IIB n=1 Tax=Paraliobacillus sp. PM-2 TaxID=1462524 RepID=UPI00061BED21|nr:PTS sugar transporter subunit IIB [Paraliobacillus sp. PM-2]CQR45918.1 Lichenan-specific phosphotransferase enzyme IIB component [Paraliobacillus sp. PM-2]
MNILLICEAGASTGILVNRMKTFVSEHEKLKHKEININATSVNSLRTELETGKVDVVLVAPQIRSKEDDVKELCQSKSVSSGTINSVDYGRIDAPAVIKFAIELYKNISNEK